MTNLFAEESNSLFSAYNTVTGRVVPVTVNEKIAELLAWSGLTQQQLADKIGVTRSNVSAYVTGKSTVSIEQAYKIAEALDVTPWTVLNCEPLPVTSLDLSREEQKLIHDLRSMTVTHRKFFIGSVNLMKKLNAEK